MLIILLCTVLQLVLASRTGSRVELLQAIKTRPDYHLLRNGEMTTRIRGAEKRLLRPRSQLKATIPGLVCQATVDLSNYTRFKKTLLHNSLEVFQRLYERSSYKRLKEAIRTGLEMKDQRLVFSLCSEILDMCQLVLPEDDDSDAGTLTLSRQRVMLKLICVDRPEMMDAILNDNFLVTEAMQVIEKHLFLYLAPADLDIRNIEPSDISELGYATLQFIYNLLLRMVSEDKVESPTFKLIEEYPEFVQKVFQLLYLPDARERLQIDKIIIELFNTHPNLRKQMVALLKFKYEEMRDYFSEDYAFIYHDILTIHRGFYIMVKDDEQIQNVKMQRSLAGIFSTYSMPLLAHPDLPHYADQWAFIMLEIGPDVDDCLVSFFDFAFSSGTPHSHYYRDRETMNILENMISETEMTADSMIIVIRLLLEKAVKMQIRPSMQEDMLTTFFAEGSIIHQCFNIHNGEMLNAPQQAPFAMFEIVVGLRKLFVAFHKYEFEMPKNLIDIIERIWEGEFEFMDFWTRPGVAMMEDQTIEITKIKKKYELAKAEHLKNNKK